MPEDPENVAGNSNTAQKSRPVIVSIRAARVTAACTAWSDEDDQGLIV